MVRYIKGMSDRHPAEEETAMQRFIDKVIPITGAAEEMSRAIALAFAKDNIENQSVTAFPAISVMLV